MRARALLIAMVGVAALGAAPSDERISQAGWARMLADRMGIPAASEADAVALLGGRGGVVEVSAEAARLVSAEGAQRSWRWDVTVPRTSIWLLSVATRTSAFVSVDKSPSTLVAAAPAGRTSSDAGRYPLAAGAHTITLATVAQNGTAPSLTLVGGCSTVEPAGGWTNAPLTYGVLARTLVQAMRQNGRLPAVEALPSVAIRGGRASLAAPADGTYTVLLSGTGLDGLTYRLDSCDETRLFAAATADGWREGATVPLERGEHTITISGAAARTDLKARLVRRSTSDTDYLSVLQAMGVKLQPIASLHEAEGTKMASMVGGPRRAKGDPALGNLAKQEVRRSDALRIVSTQPVARFLANSLGTGFKGPDQKKRDDRDPLDELEGPNTFQQPVSPTLPGSQMPDPL